MIFEINMWDFLEDPFRDFGYPVLGKNSYGNSDGKIQYKANSKDEVLSTVVENFREFMAEHIRLDDYSIEEMIRSENPNVDEHEVANFLYGAEDFATDEEKIAAVKREFLP